MYSGLDHVGFAVSEIERSSAWYTDLLGAPPVLRKTWEQEYVARILGYPEVVLDCAFWRLPGGTVLELLEYVVPAPGRVDMETFNVGNGHLCLVTEDIHRDFERLRGIAEFRDPEPTPIPWGPYQGGWACYLRDPDGISIEILQAPPGGPRLDAGPA
jgi:catechol 2,3-dioxygenase-like lactoylglutathione lyase family enzyme